jgi:hypothetical protein
VQTFIREHWIYPVKSLGRVSVVHAAGRMVQRAIEASAIY